MISLELKDPPPLKMRYICEGLDPETQVERHYGCSRGTAWRSVFDVAVGRY